MQLEIIIEFTCCDRFSQAVHYYFSSHYYYDPSRSRTVTFALRDTHTTTALESCSEPSNFSLLSLF
jgi:hypothetical protein